MNIYTIGILGDKRTGKTTYLERLTTGEFNRKYIPTSSCKTYPYKETTTEGNFHFIFKDIPIDDIESHINDCHGFIIFYNTFDQVDNFILINGKVPVPNPKCKNEIFSKSVDNKKYIDLCRGKHYVLFENKYDLSNIEYKNWQDDKISMKTCTNYELPLITLLRKITSNNKLNYYNENEY